MYQRALRERSKKQITKTKHNYAAILLHLQTFVNQSRHYTWYLREIPFSSYQHFWILFSEVGKFLFTPILLSSERRCQSQREKSTMGHSTSLTSVRITNVWRSSSLWKTCSVCKFSLFSGGLLSPLCLLHLGTFQMPSAMHAWEPVTKRLLSGPF